MVAVTHRTTQVAALFAALFLSVLLLATPALAQTDPYSGNAGNNAGNQGNGAEVLGNTVRNNANTGRTPAAFNRNNLQAGNAQRNALAFTGAETATLALAGVSLVAAGTVVVMVSRRRQTA